MTVQPYQAMPAGMANGTTAPVRQVQGLSQVIHGLFKVGKSGFGVSGPRPVLLIDVEAAGAWAPGRKIYWNPAQQTAPAYDGSWDICVVLVQDINTIYAVSRVLRSGQHPFNSISVDSVPAVAQRAMMAMAGLNKMERDDWGKLLRHILGIVMDLKDLLTHPTNPVWAVTFICPTHYDPRLRKWRPWLQGQAQDLMPYQPDIEGYMYADAQGGRHLWIGPSAQYETGNRLWGRLPDDLPIGHPGVVQGWTVESMVQHVIATQ